MRNQRIWFFYAIVAISVLAAATLLLRVNQDRYDGPKVQGQRLAWWLTAYSAEEVSDRSLQGHLGNSAGVKRAAETAIKELGSNAIPYLENTLVRRSRSSKSFPRKLLIYVFGSSYQKRLNIEDSLPDASVLGFKILGAQASGAAPFLLRVANDQSNPSAALRATEALTFLGEPGISALKELLNAVDTSTQRNAIFEISSTGTNGEWAIPILLSHLSSDSDHVREACVVSLGYVTTHNEDTVFALGRSTRDPSPRVRAAAIVALSRAGLDAKSQVNEIRRATQDNTLLVRAAASNALSTLSIIISNSNL
jgi:hypothetical protein